MHELVDHVDGCEPDVRFFRVSSVFDDADRRNAGIDELLLIAKELTGRSVGCCGGSGEAVELSLDGGVLARGAEVMRVAAASELHDFRARELALVDDVVLAASTEGESGVRSIVWLGREGEPWRPVDEMVVERLARAASRCGHPLSGPADASAAQTALAGLLCHDPDVVQRGELARRAGIGPGRLHIVLAVVPVARGAVRPQTLSAVVERSLAKFDVIARTTPLIGMVAAVIDADSSRLEAALDHLADAPSRYGCAVQAGVSRVTDLEGLADAWDTACDALMLHRLLGTPGHIARGGEASVLQLLAHVPAEQVSSLTLVRRLGELSRLATPTDEDVLTAFVEEGSLRRAASRVRMHHTLFENRLRRIGSRLQVDLSNPGARFEVNLALKLRRIVALRATPAR